MCLVLEIRLIVRERECLKDEINYFCDQTRAKGLNINHEKTKKIRFCLNHKPDCKCSSTPTAFCEESEIKILGVIFQSNCLFTQHTVKLLSHLRSLLYLLKDLRLKNVPLKDVSQIFDALIISKIRYAISVYGSDVNALRKVDTFLEKCYVKKYCTTRVFVHDILKEEDHRLRENILCNPRHPLHSVLHSQRKTRTTRHNFFGTKPRARTKTFMTSFCNRVLTL